MKARSTFPSEELAAGPYKGLAPFDDTDLDAFFFFGRERERDLIIANLAAAPLTVLYGVSGVGKSSVLSAGVAHHIRAGVRGDADPEVAVIVFGSWGGDPVADLRLAVASEARRLVGETPFESAESTSLADFLSDVTEAIDGELYLILDQLEEYFLYHGETTEPGTLADELAEIVGNGALRVSVLLSVREDELAKLDVLKRRLPNLFGNSLRLQHLDRRSGRAAILGPLERWNELGDDDVPFAAEAEFVEAVLDQVTAGRIEPGLAGRGAVEAREKLGRVEAPYLQLVLQRVFEVEQNAGSRTLRLATLEELGGAQQVIEEHLDQAMRALSPGEQELAASMFDHLVTPSGMKIAHDLGDLATYAAAGEDDVERVVRSLAGDRILRPLGNGRDGGRYEIYHDVLAEAVLAWRTRHEARRQLVLERLAARARHRRLVAIATASLVALLALTVVTVFALRERARADERAVAAQARELAATAFSQLTVDPELSLTLALEAARLEPSPRVEDALRRALIESRVRSVLRPSGSADLLGATLLPDGSSVVALGEDGALTTMNRRTRDVIRSSTLGGPVRTASFTPDGDLVLTVGPRGSVRLIRTDTGRNVATFIHPQRASSTGLGPNGRFLVTAATDARVRIFELPVGRLAGSFALDRVPRSVAVNADGSVVATGDREADGEGQRMIRIWTVGGRLIRRVPSAIGSIRTLAFSAASDRVAAGTGGGVAQVWDAHSGRVVSRMIGHANFVTSVAFSQDGDLLVTAGPDRTARIWDAATGRPLAVLRGHQGTVESVFPAAAGDVVVTASQDGTARLWDARGEPRLSLVRRFAEPIGDAAAGRDGHFAAAVGNRILFLRRDGSQQGSLRRREDVETVAFGRDERVVAGVGRRVLMWRPPSGSVQTLLQPAHVSAATLAPSGRSVLAGAVDGLARIWRLDGTLVRTLGPHGDAVLDAEFDRSGGRVVTASADRIARIWSVGGQLLRELEGHRSSVTAASFSPNGRFVLTASADHDARIWDASSGRPLRVLRGHFGPVNDASFSDDGRWVVTAGPVSAALWEVASGELVFYLRGHEGRVRSAFFTPGGHRVVTAADDRTLRTYRCDICGRLDALVALAERRLARSGRTLTSAERRRFLPEEGTAASPVGWRAAA
ncbi:MAG: WD40 repeat domain-containing protein [Gaiellales bacterium]